ncbi:MAG: class I SAM-dependent methyltransferase [Pegethrix bostrychoides GSE-TBD4-15B]|jgi:SAM-dependent methyltransferase|uniref:Class I SAM-dependent methyltransferase n=1 Tax=Pegethrix bostrychoides GSE-TBD4-15B TaxID=2839662 RepID=A0A951PCM6_9CYAN|nr:class I SAM-dependent methyltransferase [Pegethrix bostrychoides GSE-TBD4-15B]
MAQKRSESKSQDLSSFLGSQSPTWQEQFEAVALRFNREYRRDSFELPAEVLEMPIYQEWQAGLLTSRVTSPFWELAKPKKNQRCLDLGCGVSFLIYPWNEWEAVFYGQEISSVPRDLLNSRGSQLNSKLFKGVQLAPANELDYPAAQFDLVFATGFSCYYPLAYWQDVLAAVKSVLKPDGFFVFDAIDSDAEMAENWAILETYLGAEVFLESLADWKKLIQQSGAKIVKQQPGDLFQLFKLSFG